MTLEIPFLTCDRHTSGHLIGGNNCCINSEWKTMNQDLDPITLLVDMPCARKSVSIIWKFEKNAIKGYLVHGSNAHKTCRDK